MTSSEIAIDESTTEEVEETPYDEPKKMEYDIVKVLEATDHLTNEYPNGLTLGVRLKGIAGTRGVHIETVYVVDLRKASFGKAALAMQAAVLDIINRELHTVLQDVGLGARLVQKRAYTMRGRICVPTLTHRSGSGCSMIHDTRIVYVVTDTVRPTTDLEWLTSQGRVLNADDLALARRSDVRSVSSDITKCVASDKWELLEQSMTRFVYGSLTTAASVFFGLVAILLTVLGSGNPLMPAVASLITGTLGSSLLWDSRKTGTGFVESVTEEESALSVIGDRARIAGSVTNNEEKLVLIGDLSFIVTPMMGGAASALLEGNLDSVVKQACAVLDECVRLSPADENDGLSDEGLSKFVGLFKSIGLILDESERASLMLSYTSLTGHPSTPLSEEEIVQAFGTLNLHLYNSGMLRHEVWDKVSDMVNKRACDSYLKETEEVATNEPDLGVEDDIEEAKRALEELRQGSEEKDIVTSEDVATSEAVSIAVEPEMPEIAAETVESVSHQEEHTQVDEAAESELGTPEESSVAQDVTNTPTEEIIEEPKGKAIVEKRTSSRKRSRGKRKRRTAVEA